MNEVQKLVVESQMRDFQSAFDSLAGVDDPRLTELRLEFGKLQEEITAGDWGRIGVLAGMLWYKLDTLINHLGDMKGALHAIERNTAKK